MVQISVTRLELVALIGSVAGAIELNPPAHRREIYVKLGEKLANVLEKESPSISAQIFPEHYDKHLRHICRR